MGYKTPDVLKFGGGTTHIQVNDKFDAVLCLTILNDVKIANSFNKNKEYTAILSTTR